MVHLMNGYCDGSLVTVVQRPEMPYGYNNYDVIPEESFANYVIDAYNDKTLINHIEALSPMRHIWRLTGVNLNEIEKPAIHPDGMYLCCNRDKDSGGWIYTVHFKEYEMEDGEIDGWEVEEEFDG